MSTVNPTDTHHHDDHHHGPVTLADGVWPWMKRWIGTTNHKDLGTLYLIFSFTMLFIGGIESLIIRAELFAPGIQFVDPAFPEHMQFDRLFVEKAEVKELHLEQPLIAP